MLFAGWSFQALLYLLIAFLINFTFHEASHAWVAYRLGDPTAKEAGRLTLNPLRHLHPLGTLFILIVGLGWGRPVPVNASRLRYGPKAGMALVGMAGPAANLLIATAFAIPLRLRMIPFRPRLVGGVPISYGEIVAMIVWLGLALALFNLIPFTPLDGSRLLGVVLPDRIFYWLARYELIFLGLFIGLVLMERFSQGGILTGILFPPVEFLWHILTRFQSNPFGV
jgi:Zn-dependent protease